MPPIAAAPPPSGAGAPGAGQQGAGRPAWTFLTNHGHVLLAVAGSGDARVSDIATQVGITTRATLTILKDLETAGYLTRHRTGRRSHYTVDTHRHFRHPATATHEVGELLAIFASDAQSPDHTWTEATSDDDIEPGAESGPTGEPRRRPRGSAP